MLLIELNGKELRTVREEPRPCRIPRPEQTEGNIPEWNTPPDLLWQLSVDEPGRI